MRNANCQHGKRWNVFEFAHGIVPIKGAERFALSISGTQIPAQRLSSLIAPPNDWNIEKALKTERNPAKCNKKRQAWSEGG
jgi:hypothetical protein